MNSSCLFQRRHRYSRNGAIIRKPPLSQLASFLYFFVLDGGADGERGEGRREGGRKRGDLKYLVTEKIILFITQP